VHTERRERADATRNRAAILRATEELLSSRRADEITVEQVAAAAGVGKGTVFHRFGSKTGLLTALMQERTRDLSTALEDGPPPLGPGAPPRERILAFLTAATELIGRNKGMVAALDLTCRPPGPEVAERPVYQTWHAHLSEQLRLDRPDLDHEMAAHLLLSGLHSGPIQQRLEPAELERLAAALRHMARGILSQGLDPSARDR
jgi:AcrR family transcriptional regulator